MRDKFEILAVQLGEEKEKVVHLESMKTTLSNELDSRKNIKINIASNRPQLKLKPIEDLVIKTPDKRQDENMKDQIKDFESQVELLAEDNTRLESNTESLKRQLKEKESEIEHIIQDNVQKTSEISRLTQLVEQDKNKERSPASGSEKAFQRYDLTTDFL